MIHLLIWTAVLGLGALWSLAAWCIHSIAAWAVDNAGVLAGGTWPVEVLRWPDWLAPWVPTEITLAIASLLSAFKPAIQALVEWAPALGGGLSVAIWLGWGVGLAVLLFIGLSLSGLTAMARRRAAVKAGPSVVAGAAR